MTSSRSDGASRRHGTAAPTVSVLITAYNRADELRATLRALRHQDYPALELIVVDDASREALEPVVREEWPGARFWRNPRNLGYIVNRSRAMARATGAYLLTLDDDSHPVDADAISRAVARMEREPELGVIAFRVHEGLEPPVLSAPVPPEQYTYAFIGCGVLIRASVASEVGGYREYFEYYKEEAEYALRVLDRGHRILYVPELVVHHRLSPVGRSAARIAAYSVRNSIWTVLLDLRAAQAAIEAPWKALIGAIEVARQGEVRWLAWAMASTVRGLPRVLRDRAPISRAATRTYRALRYREIYTLDALRDAHPPTWRQRWHWFRTVWFQRRRPRAVWDRREGATGVGTWTTGTRPPRV